MTTVEKLLVQIFERKHSFIEQVKQQTQLHYQLRASKLLIDGITPPSWLWNPNSSPDLKVLNKEELISKLLRTYPQPPVCYSVENYPVYSNLAVTGDSEEFSDGVFMENLPFDRGLIRQDGPTVPTLNREDDGACALNSVENYPVYSNLAVTGDSEEFSDAVFMENLPFDRGLIRQDGPTVPALNREDDGACSLNSVAELDTSVTSPEDQAVERILNIYNAADQSIAGIQRSKSRQKALELRSSSKALAKSGLRHESTSDVLAGQISYSLSATNQSCQKDELPKLAEPCVIGSEICDHPYLAEADRLSKENGMTGFDGITSSRSRSKVPVYVGGTSDVLSGQIRYSLSATSQSSQKDELPKLAEPCVIGSQICDHPDLAEADRLSKEIGMTGFGRITRSRSRSMVPVSVSVSSTLDCSRAYAGRITRSRSRSKVPIYVGGSSTFGHSSEDFKDLSPSHVAKERRGQSMPISDSERADNYVNKLPKSAGPTVCSQSHGGRKLDGAHCLSKDKGFNAYSGRITRSKISSKHQNGHSSSNAESSSDDYEKIGVSMMDSRDDLTGEYASGSLVKNNPSNALNEGCDARGSEDNSSHKERGTIPSWSSSQQNACVDEISDLEIHSHSAKADGGILDPSSGIFAKQVNDTNDAQGLVEHSAGLFPRVIRSQTWSNDKEPYEPVTCNEIPSFGGIIAKSDCKQTSAAIDELRNTSSGEFIPLCNEIHDMLDEQMNPDFIVGDLVLHDHVNQSGRCSSSDAKQRIELASQVVLTPSGSFLFVEPKQLSFNEIEECNLKAFTSSSGKKRLDNPLETMSCSLSISGVSLDKGISGGADQLLLGKQSTGMTDVSSKADEEHLVSSESNVLENPDNKSGKFGPVISNTMLKPSEDNTEAGLTCEISGVHHKPVCTVSKMADIPDVHIPPVKLHVEHGLESLAEEHMEEAGWTCEGKDKGQSLSSAPESKNLRPSHCHNSAKQPRAESCDCLIEEVEMTNPICVVLDKIKQFPKHQSQILSCSQPEDSPPTDESLVTYSAVRSHVLDKIKQFPKHQSQILSCSQPEDSPPTDEGLVTYSAVRSHDENLPLERSFRQVSLKSWPQLKRRKIEHQETHGITISPRFRVGKPPSSRRGSASTYLENLEINKDTVLMDTFHIRESIGTEICQEMESNLTEEIESTFLSQNGEVEFCYKEKNDCKEPSSIITNEQSGGARVSSLIKESRNSQGCFLEEIRAKNPSSNHVDARGLGDGQCSLHLFNIVKNNKNLHSENLSLTNSVLEGIQSPKWEGGLQTQHSVISPSNEVMEPIDVNQFMPVLEGFIVDAQSDNGELDFAADGFDFDKLDLPRTTIERASILAEICRSASLDEPASHFSSAFEFQGTEILYQSVPNDQLDHLGLGSTLSMNSDVGKQLQFGSSSGNDCKDTVERMPYSDSLAYSGARYCWNSRNQYTSPVGNLWERLSSHTGSSEKRLSSNPELTCFPIEEDPGISEENRTVDENADDIQEEIDSSLANHCDERQPLTNLTNLGLDLLMSASALKETFRAADHVDFASTKSSVTGAQEKVLWSPKNQYMNRREIKEKQASFISATDGRKKQTSSISTNGIRKGKDSINNSNSKPNLSKKNSLKRQDQKLSLKDSRRNNIVSNVSSFIPLIQKKQATVCAGKRDVKVKALEAAEAAKHLEEKKENERKMKKEALKVERAKLEEKNLRDMELEKKKKEAERKKKDADIISKKRVREEEERKEKEKKRMRLEARHRERAQQEKMRTEKAGKEFHRSKDEKFNSKNEFHRESTKQQDEETVRGDNVALKKTEAKLTPTEVVMNYEECSTSGQSCQAGKAMHTMDKSPKNEDLIVQSSKGKSYEISPYQCSDDEDEEDDELPTKKYIPSWASKSSVALHLPLQREMDPDTIFPPESFCSMDEVLLPRKLQQKQMAA